MTKINLPELKRLSKEATKGEWKVFAWEDRRSMEIRASTGELVGEFYWHHSIKNHNPDLIAQMRNSIDTLIGALEEARGALEYYRDHSYYESGVRVYSPAGRCITKLDAAIDFGSGGDK